MVDKIAFLYLRLPFGTTPKLVEYTNVSKAATYIGDYLLRDESCDTYDLN